MWGFSEQTFHGGALCTIWIQIYCVKFSVQQTCWCITDSLRHTSYLQTNKVPMLELQWSTKKTSRQLVVHRYFENIDISRTLLAILLNYVFYVDEYVLSKRLLCLSSNDSSVELIGNARNEVFPKYKNVGCWQTKKTFWHSITLANPEFDWSDSKISEILPM